MRSTNVEVTSIALQPSAASQAALQDGAAAAGTGEASLLVVSCPALSEADTIAVHACALQAAVAAAPAQSAHAAGAFQAAVVQDGEAAAATAAAASALGLALLLLRSDDTCSWTADMVYVTAAYSTAAAKLMARHLQVPSEVQHAMMLLQAVALVGQ